MNARSHEPHASLPELGTRPARCTTSGKESPLSPPTVTDLTARYALRDSSTTVGPLVSHRVSQSCSSRTNDDPSATRSLETVATHLTTLSGVGLRTAAIGLSDQWLRSKRPLELKVRSDFNTAVVSSRAQPTGTRKAVLGCVILVAFVASTAGIVTSAGSMRTPLRSSATCHECPHARDTTTTRSSPSTYASRLVGIFGEKPTATDHLTSSQSERRDAHNLRAPVLQVFALREATDPPAFAAAVKRDDGLRRPVIGFADLEKQQSTPTNESAASSLSRLIRAASANPTVGDAASHQGFYEPLRFGWRAAEGGVEPSWSHARPFDAVITFVDGAAPGMSGLAETYAAVRNVTLDPGRLRDLGELRYLIRSLHRFGAGLIRRIVLVVADEGHVPKWINRTSTEIPFAFVTHAELFPDPVNQLPTFNSFSIETVLHRIPGLSEYFLYFNNDMLLGRRLSLLDLFRPVAGGSVADGAVDVESILYADAAGAPVTCALRSADARPDTWPQLECAAPATHEAAADDPHALFRDLYTANNALVWERLRIVPTHAYAHTFKFVRTSLWRAMVDVAFADVVTTVRMAKFRQPTNFWATYVYQYVELAHRTGQRPDVMGVEKALQECTVALALTSPLLGQHRHGREPPAVSPRSAMNNKTVPRFRASLRRLYRAAWEESFLSSHCLGSSGDIPHRVVPLRSTRLQSAYLRGVIDGCFSYEVPKACASVGLSTNVSTIWTPESDTSTSIVCFDTRNIIRWAWGTRLRHAPCPTAPPATAAPPYRVAIPTRTNRRRYHQAPCIAPPDANSAPFVLAIANALGDAQVQGVNETNDFRWLDDVVTTVRDAMLPLSEDNAATNNREPLFAPVCLFAWRPPAASVAAPLLAPDAVSKYPKLGRPSNFVVERFFAPFLNVHDKPFYQFHLASDISVLSLLPSVISADPGQLLVVTVNDDLRSTRGGGVFNRYEPPSHEEVESWRAAFAVLGVGVAGATPCSMEVASPSGSRPPLSPSHN